MFCIFVVGFQAITMEKENIKIKIKYKSTQLNSILLENLGEK